MESKYLYNSDENKAFLKEQRDILLKFGTRFPSHMGSSYYLGDDGTPMTERPRETWITSRMAHVYSIGALLGFDGAKELATKAIAGLATELKDKENDGWYAGINADGSILPTKQCYANAFVILASTSALLAKVDGADKLLESALEVYNKYFWDEEQGLARDTWNTQFTQCDTYRGINSNMHTVEAFLAVADATGDEIYRDRAGRIIKRVIGWAKENNYRIPEHFSEDWQPCLELNSDKPDDPFKPYGATPGHGIEWARLILQWKLSVEKRGIDSGISTEDIECLFNRAVQDAWNADGEPGICYTTDWNGKPVVRDRMHWTLAEAINTSSLLIQVTGKKQYSNVYGEFMKYLDEKVIDHVNGSWFHQLDENNNLKGTVWPGKSDLYHAFQATLIPYSAMDISIAAAVSIANK